MTNQDSGFAPIFSVPVDYNADTGLYVFDDHERGIAAEPFMALATKALHELLWRDLIKRRGSFQLRFCEKPFEEGQGEQALWEIHLLAAIKTGGAWYLLPQFHKRPSMQIELCPVVSDYFVNLPPTIYLRLSGPIDEALDAAVTRSIGRKRELARTAEAERESELVSASNEDAQNELE